PAAATGVGDAAFGAYQRGQFLTAFREATQRVEAGPDPVSMTLLAELHANGLGVPRNDQRALGWYRLAADRGDRNAIFALAMMHVEGRAGQTRDPAAAKALFERAAALGHPAAGYNLGLLAFSGQGGQPDPIAAARWFQMAADLGNADAQYALAVLLKDGNGLPADPARAAALMEKAARQDLIEAEIDYGIMLFNGQGVAKDEAAAAQMFRRAALRGNPLAMNRFARLLAAGRGVAADPLMAAQWHTTARLLGAEDSWLTDFVGKLDPVQREAAERGARNWLR
ncbi:MAG: tetratricopeptide repeat protein, partial [Phreatobacter sp.]